MPRHRAPRRGLRRIAAAAAVAALGAGAAIASGLALAHTPAGTPWLPQQASAVVQAVVQATPVIQATTTAKINPNWTDQTCHAAESYFRHADAARLHRLEWNARHISSNAPAWQAGIYVRHLGIDVRQLVSDVRHHQDTGVDQQYLYADCSNGSGL
jgi:hypothetical protein